MGEKYHIPEDPVYNPEIRKLKDTDPASATRTFNPLFGQMIENTAAVKVRTETLEAEIKDSIERLEKNTGSLEEGKGKPGGLATLNEEGKIPEEQLPEMDYDVAGTAEAVRARLAEQINAHAADEELHVTAVKQSGWTTGAQTASAAKTAAVKVQAEALATEITASIETLEERAGNREGK